MNEFRRKQRREEVRFIYQVIAVLLILLILVLGQH